MHTVTLLTKAYNNSRLGTIRELLKSDLESLKVELEVPEPTPRGWVRVTVSGEDEKTALNYLTREFGQCLERLEHVERFSTINGRITAFDRNKAEISVDIGVLTPQVVDANVPLIQLQSQLVDGRKVALKKLAELFAFNENSPLTVKILNVDAEENHVEAMLAEKQLSQYRDWTRSLLERLIVLGAAYHEVEWALKRAGLGRDIVTIEPLGLLEQAIVCKLGTDAAGLIPRIGRNLYRAAFSVFSPQRILEFLQDSSAWLIS